MTASPLRWLCSALLLLPGAFVSVPCGAAPHAREMPPSAAALKRVAEAEKSIEHALHAFAQGQFAQARDLSAQAAEKLDGTPRIDQQAEAYFLAGEAEYRRCLGLRGEERRRCAAEVLRLFMLSMEKTQGLADIRGMPDQPHADLRRNHLRQAERWQASLVVRVHREGAGAVRSEPAGIALDAAGAGVAEADFVGEVLRLTLTPEKQHTLLSCAAEPPATAALLEAQPAVAPWAPNAAPRQCEVKLVGGSREKAAVTTVTVRFARDVTLHLRRERGRGTLRAERVFAPGSWACDGDCEYSLVGGLSLRVSAVAADRWRSLGLFGACPAGAQTCPLTVDRDLVVTARFQPVLHRQWWFWTGLVSGLAVLAGSAVGGYYLHKKGHPDLPGSPPIDLKCQYPDVYQCP